MLKNDSGGIRTHAPEGISLAGKRSKTTFLPSHVSKPMTRIELAAFALQKQCYYH